MLTWITIIVSLCAAVGSVLIALGMRGRKLDEHPICRRCGFDLHGRFPWHQPTLPTCPDCGEPLLSFDSVRRGTRVRRSPMLAAGVALCFPGIVILLAGAADTFAGKATASLKTSSMIASQISGSTKGSANLRVLTARVATGGAMAADIAPAIERALTLQADRSIELDPQWLDLLETARRRGQLSTQQQERYFKGAFDWRLLTIPTSADTPIPFAVQVFADRFVTPPSDTPMFVTVTCAYATFDGKALRYRGTSDPFTTSPRTSPLTKGALIEIIDAAGHNTEIGFDRPLQVSWGVEVHKGTATGPLLASWTQTLDAKANVEPRTFPQALSAAQEVAAVTRICKALDIRSVQLDRDPSGTCWASFSIRPSTLPCDVVSILRITTPDGQSYDSVEPVTITPSDPRWPIVTAADPTRSPWNVHVQLNGTPGGGKAIVELVPLPSSYSYALASPVWSGDPIKFADVELQWPQPKAP